MTCIRSTAQASISVACAQAAFHNPAVRQCEHLNNPTGRSGQYFPDLCLAEMVFTVAKMADKLNPFRILT